MTENVLKTEDVGAIRVITLNRPHRMNAIDLDLGCALRDAVAAACADAGVRAVVITGEGSNFCTGGDLRRDRSKEAAAGVELVDIVQEAFLALRHGDKASVAAVQGHAQGAGLSLMLACDFAIADTTAKFGAPFTGAGLVPDMGLAITLPERVGIGMARDMVLCGTVKDAAAALAAGLVDMVCEPGRALPAAMEKAAVLAGRAPLAIAGARVLLNRTRDPLELVLGEESRRQKALRQTEDSREAIAAFGEKRRPQFKGR